MPEEEKKEEKKKEEKKDEDKVVLKVDMHCEACKEKVRKSMMGFPGLEKIDIDMKTQKVTIKGKVDAKKLFEHVKKKSGKRTELIYPELKKIEEKKEQKKEEKKKEEVIIDSISMILDSIAVLFPKPRDVTVVLKVNMHCEGCANEVKKSLTKMDGVYDVKVDLGSDKVTVKGKNIDPKKVCDRVIKKNRKHAEIVPPKKDEKNDEKKEDKKDEKKGEKKEEKDGDKDGEKKGDSKKSENTPSKSVPEYVYPPQLFSDENPNACSIM